MPTSKPPEPKRAYSKRSFLVHGKYWTPKWDFAHHVVPPMSSSSTYRLETPKRGAMGFCGFAAPGTPHGKTGIYVYDRLDEPTRSMLEDRLAYAEGGDTAICFATGMAAIAASIGVLVRAGDEILAHQTLYGCTYSLLSNWMPRFGVRVRYVDMTRLGALRRAMTRRTRVVYYETPVNPTLDVLDIAAISEIVRRHRRAVSIVDNTFATPFCQRPLGLGADMVVHSLTKNICGFGTDMGGAVATRQEFDSDLLVFRKDFGAPLASKSAWPILVYGLPSLEVRVREQERTAMEVARFLAAHPKVHRVSYPGLEDSPHADVARRQMTDYNGNFAPGTLIYFTMAPRAANRLVEWIARHSYTITLAVSLGQVRTLIEQPGTMTHAVVPKGAKSTGGIHPGGVRLSMGLEDPADILGDLREALAHA